MEFNPLVASTYNATARHYRLSDEVHVSGKDYRLTSQCLSHIASRFPKAISVLDLGCGTGRYFHCIPNAYKITGVDVSEGMLEEARAPLKTELIKADIELVHADITTVEFAPASFDFIYSIGVFGHGCGLSDCMARRLGSWLKPAGIVFFDAFDARGFQGVVRLRKQMKARLYSALPPRLQKMWNNWSGWPPFFLSEGSELYSTMTRAGFNDVQIRNVQALTERGPALKLQCIAELQHQI